eukprot:GDKK01078781.1.p1 GENE.GDKK01078781.1~~GDKK01078781.1.p1  ORF type:complete len:127 (+),score=14.07 GDKK01078781.1:73-453(+)
MRLLEQIVQRRILFVFIYQCIQDYGIFIKGPNPHDEFHGLKSIEHYDPKHPHWKFVEEQKKKSYSRDWKATSWSHGQDWVLSQPISKDGTFCGTPVPTTKQRKSLYKYVRENVLEENNCSKNTVFK